MNTHTGTHTQFHGIKDNCFHVPYKYKEQWENVHCFMFFVFLFFGVSFVLL